MIRRRTLVGKKENKYASQYLTFKCAEGVNSMTISAWLTGNVSYSLNNGASWNTLLGDGSDSITVQQGVSVMFKGNLTPDVDYYGIGSFQIYAQFEAEGNIMSLLYGDDFIGKTQPKIDGVGHFGWMFNSLPISNIDNLVLPMTTLTTQCYMGMFGDCNYLTRIPSGFLPATTLASNCYERMFYGCTGLTSIPSTLLPATTLASNCYHEMFYGCTGLASIPSTLLPATTLANYCYSGMLRNCTGLTSIPSTLLPATTLAQYCYQYMFASCTGLTTIPSTLLPATTLKNNCYEYMFLGCTNITTAPNLTATKLVSSCYARVFYNCTKLNSIRMLATNISATDCLKNWVTNVASSGTFYKKSGVTIPTGTSGIPSGWTVVNE